MISPVARWAARLRRVGASGMVEWRVARPLRESLSIALRVGERVILARDVEPLWRGRRRPFLVGQFDIPHDALLGAPQTVALWDMRRGRRLAALTLGEAAAPLTLGHAEPIDGGLSTGWAALRPQEEPVVIGVSVEGLPKIFGETREFRADIFAAARLTQAGFRLRLPQPATPGDRRVSIDANGAPLPGGDQIWTAEQQILAALCAAYADAAALQSPAEARDRASRLAALLAARPELARANPVSVGEALIGALGLLLALDEVAAAARLLIDCPALATALARGDGRMLEAARALVDTVPPALRGALADALESAGGAQTALLAARTRLGAAEPGAVGPEERRARAVLETAAADPALAPELRFLARDSLAAAAVQP